MIPPVSHVPTLTRTQSPLLHRRRLAVATAIAAAGIGWLAASLPPEGFYSGDSGLKLIAADNAIHHPARPFETDLPAIAGRPLPYVDPMVALHEGHGDVLQSALFPLISAPFIAIAGVRGAYVLPALAFIALLPLLDAVRRVAAPDTSFPLLAWIAVAANPLFFYSLEFWEHSVAVALLAGSSAAALAGSRSTRAIWVVSSGALAGLAALLRPEAVWYIVGLCLVVGRRQWVAFGSGVAAVLIPFAAVNLGHSGTLLGPHASANLAPLAHDYLAARWQRIDAWLRPDAALAYAGLVLVAAAWIGGIFNMELRVRQVVALLGVVAISAAAAQRLLPRDSFWQAFPLSLLAFVPTTPLPPFARRLRDIALVTFTGVILTATHDGGAQWGARLLLVTAPPLMVLAARAATEAIGAGRWQVARIALVLVALIAGLATSRAAYQELRSTKREYGRLVQTTASLTAPGEVIVTNVWWFDQIAASLYGSRVFLYTADRASATNALDDLMRANVRRLALVWASDADASLNDVVGASCFRLVGVQEIPEHRLRLASAQCGPD